MSLQLVITTETKRSNMKLDSTMATRPTCDPRLCAFESRSGASMPVISCRLRYDLMLPLVYPLVINLKLVPLVRRSARCGLVLQMAHVAWSVLGTPTRCANTAEPIETLPFASGNSYWPNEPCIWRGRDATSRYHYCDHLWAGLEKNRDLLKNQKSRLFCFKSNFFYSNRIFKKHLCKQAIQGDDRE